MRKLALLLLCATALSGCQTILITHKEALLESAGFKATPADTSERQAAVTKLLARQFVEGMQGTSPVYIYADPDVCNCLYVGSEAAYSKYLGRVNVAAMTAGGLPSSYNNTSSKTWPSNTPTRPSISGK